MRKIKNILVFVGSYHKDNTFENSDRGEGIYVFRMNPNSGELTLLKKGIGKPNPSYIILDHTGKYLYSTNETSRYNEIESGCISSFSLDPESGDLTLLNRVTSGGTDPCYIKINKFNSYILVANYTSGSIAMFPIASNGFLGSISYFSQHKGNSINKKRQVSPHPHAIELDSGNFHAFVPDLGCDKIFIYTTNFKNGCLNVADPAYIEIEKGEGPRHCVFHPSNKYFYVITEMGSSIYSYYYNEIKGVPTLSQIISTLPNEYSGQKWGAAIKILPGGNFLYGSNRGHDSIAIYRINNYNGKLDLVAIQPTGGLTPRDFDFDYQGNFLIVANQTSNNIVVFKINKGNGLINEVFRVNNIFAPTCIKTYAFE